MSFIRGNNSAHQVKELIMGIDWQGIEYNSMISQVFKVLRGDQSRQTAANRIQVDKSTIYKWETLRSKPKWDDLIRYCRWKNKIVNSDADLFKRYYDFDITSGHSIISCFVENDTFKNVKTASRLSQSSIYSLIEGRSSPKVETIFRVWSLTNRQSFLLFLEKLVGLENLEETADFSKRWKLEESLSLRYPFFGGLIYAIDSGLDKSLGSIQKLAFFLGCGVSEIRKLIEILIDSDMISLEGCHYKLNQDHCFDSGCNFAVNKRMQKFWTGNALRHLDNSRHFLQDSLFNYHLMSLDKEGSRKIQNEYKKFFDTCREIANNSKKGDKKFHTLSLQLVSFDEALEPAPKRREPFYYETIN